MMAHQHPLAEPKLNEEWVVKGAMENEVGKRQGVTLTPHRKGASLDRGLCRE